MKSSTVQFDYTMYVSCPYCDTDMDLVDQDDDGVYSSKIFTNKWDELKGEACYCKHCDNIFLIEEVVY